MADVVVASEVTADSSQFIADLAKDQSALDQFASYANSLKIAPQIQIDSTTATNSFKATLAQMVADAQQQGSAINLALAAQLSSVPVTLNTVQAQAQLQSLVASVQSITLTFNAPSAQQIGMDIGNAAAQAMAAAMGAGGAGGGGGQIGGFGGGGGGGGGNAAGGRSLASYLPHGFGRLLMPLMALHQGMRYFSIQDQEQEHMDASGGDVAKMLEADIRRKKEEDSLLMGAGRVMRFARENTVGALMGESSVEEQEGDLRSLKNSAMREKFEEHDIQTRQKHDFEYRREMAPSSQAEKQEELREKQLTREQGDKKSSAERSKEIEELAYARRVAAEHQAKSLGRSIDKDATSQSLREQADAIEANLAVGTHSKQADDLRVLASTLGTDTTAAERAKNNAEYGPGGTRTKQVAEMTAKENRDLADSQSLEIRQTTEKARIAEMEAGGGDDAEIQRGKLKIKLEEERQKVYSKGTADEWIAFERQSAAEEKSLDNKIQKEDIAQQRKLSDIQYKADEGARALVIGQRAASDETYVRGLDKQIEDLENLNNKTKEQIALLETLRGVRQKEVDTHAEISRRAEEFEQRSSDRKIRDTQAEAAEGLQAAYGDTRGSSRARLQRQLEDRITGLVDQADNASGPRKQQLMAQAAAELGAMPSKMGAFDIKNQREDERKLRGLEEGTEGETLRMQHRGYEAGQIELGNKYIQELQDARDAHAPQAIQDAIVNRGMAARAAYEQKNSESAREVGEHAVDQTLRNQGRGALADARKIERDDAKRLRDATGNAEMQAAITADEIAASEGRIKGEVLHPANLRSAYDQLLGAAADPGRAEARKREQAHLRDLKHQHNLEAQGLDPLTGKPLGPPGQHARDPAEMNAKASEAMTQAAKDISAAALAITSAPQVLLIGWN